MNTSEVFLARLAGANERLASTYFEHLSEFGDVVPHVLLGDMTRVLLTLGEESQSGSSSACADVDSTLTIMEQALESEEPEVRELIGASFLENLEPDARHLLVGHFGGRLCNS